MRMMGGFIGSACSSGIYGVYCEWFLGLDPVWWELCAMAGLGAFTQPSIWPQTAARWQRIVECWPRDKLNLGFFVFELAWVLATRGLLVGTTLWLLAAAAERFCTVPVLAG